MLSHQTLNPTIGSLKLSYVCIAIVVVLPLNPTIGSLKPISNTQRYKMLGNFKSHNWKLKTAIKNKANTAETPLNPTIGSLKLDGISCGQVALETLNPTIGSLKLSKRLCF